MVDQPSSIGGGSRVEDGCLTAGGLTAGTRGCPGSLNEPDDRGSLDDAGGRSGKFSPSSGGLPGITTTVVCALITLGSRGPSVSTDVKGLGVLDCPTSLTKVAIDDWAETAPILLIDVLVLHKSSLSPRCTALST